MNKKNSLFLGYFLVVLLIFSVFNACKPDPVTSSVVYVESKKADIATEWAAMTLTTVTKLPANTPTYCSRALGYLGLTMYESIVQGSEKSASIAGQFKDLKNMPIAEVGKTYNWELSLNAAQASMLKSLYEYVKPSLLDNITALETKLQTQYAQGENPEVVTRSVAFGKAVATAIFEWSKTDGGYQAYTRNFPTEYVMPTTPGSWTPPTKSQSSSKRPLHPYWGSNRTFAPANSELPVPAMIPYSTEWSSECNVMFLEVYAKSKNLTEDERKLAAWWSDDPTESFSPPGHSYSLASIAIKTDKADLMKAAETYARVGMSVADAFINCFKCKYTYFFERPSTYIQKNIDPTFVQYWPEPPFPAFSSGHSTQGAACATVLTELYGDGFSFIDNSHEGRARDTVQKVDFVPRKFNSFYEAAEESAYSRFVGGIHTSQDNEVGLREGRKIGWNINKFKWQK